MAKKKKDFGHIALPKGTRTKFLVVSYDSDQQQWFYDFVMASSPESAVSFVCENRSYVVGADATGADETLDMAEKLYLDPEAEVYAAMKNLAKQHAGEEDEPYTPRS